MLNEALEELSASRVEAITITGDLLRSKLAWKYAVLRQALSYRLVDLSEGAISCWNRSDVLASIILARSVLETGALCHSITVRARKALTKGDAAELDRLVMQESFGIRYKPWIEEDAAREKTYNATNVLTALDQMSKSRSIGFRDLYERISEMAHPNSLGVTQFYGRIDYEKHIVHFSKTKRVEEGMFAILLAALSALQFAVLDLLQIDGMLREIADLQEAHNPQG